MQTKNTVLAPPIKHAALATLAGECLGLWLGSSVLHMDHRVFGLAAVFGWLPIVVVAFQRPETPTRFDRVMMFAGFPALFVVLFLVSRYLRVP